MTLIKRGHDNGMWSLRTMNARAECGPFGSQRKKINKTEQVRGPLFFALSFLPGGSFTSVCIFKRVWPRLTKPFSLLPSDYYLFHSINTPEKIVQRCEVAWWSCLQSIYFVRVVYNDISDCESYLPEPCFIEATAVYTLWHIVLFFSARTLKCHSVSLWTWVGWLLCPFTETTKENEKKRTLLVRNALTSSLYKEKYLHICDC